MLLDAMRSRPWLYRAAKRAQPLYRGAVSYEARLMRAACTHFELYAFLHNPFGAATADHLSSDAGSASAHGVTSQYVQPDEQAQRQLPRDLPAGAVTEFSSVAHLRSGAGVIYRIVDGSLWGADGAVITHGRLLLGDLSPVFCMSPDDHPVFRRPLLTGPKTVDGPVAVVTGPSPQNLSHWFFGVLPRLSLLTKEDPELRSVRYAVLPVKTASFQTECLARFGIPAAKILHAGPGTFMRSDEIWAPSFVNPEFVAPVWFLEDLRSRFADVKPAVESPRIYVSRRAAPGRRVLNEAELLTVLEKRGFKAITLEILPFERQVALFKGAREIVASHGAGLAHLAFAAKGAHVVELFSPSYINPMYWCLADQVGLSYRCCLGVGRPSPNGANLVRSDLRLETSDISRALDAGR
jgi:hypothetical protein